VKRVERIGKMYGGPVHTRQILDVVMARTPDQTLPLAARSKAKLDQETAGGAVSIPRRRLESGMM
jgi:hypothetical protein